MVQVRGFQWDRGNWPKCGKHGVSRDQIEQLFLQGELRVAPDSRHSTEAEKRYLGVGRVDGRAVFVAFTIRDNHIRPISARYMHDKEVKSFEKSSSIQE